MSVLINGSTDRLIRAGGLGNTPDPFSFCGWIKVVSHRSDWSYVLGADDSGSANYFMIGLSNSNVLHASIVGTAGISSGVTPTPGTWYFVGITWTASTAKFYWAAEGAGSLSSGTVGSLGISSAWDFFIGTDDVGEWFNGEVAVVKSFANRQLTDAEMDAEFRAFPPQRVANLRAFYPLHESTTADFSGNGLTLTAEGTPTLSANEPAVSAPVLGTHTGAASFPTVLGPNVLVNPKVRATSTNNGTTFGAGVNVTIPTGTQVGDLILCCVSADNPSTTAVATSSTGWNRSFHETHDAVSANLMRFTLFQKVATGSDALVVTGPAQDYAIVTKSFYGHGVSAAGTELVFPTPNDSTASATPNPANNSMGSSKAWTVAAMVGQDYNAINGAITAAPTGYTASFTFILSASSTSSVGTAMATKEVTGSSEDPGTFTSTNRPWITATVAIPPGLRADLTPDAFTAPASFPTITPSAGGSGASVSPGVFTAPASFPTVTPGAGAGVTLAAFTGLSSFPALTKGAGAGVTLAVFTGLPSFPTVTPGAGAGVTPAVFTGLSSFPALSLAAASSVSLAAFTGVSNFPTLTVSGAGAVTLAAFTGLASFPTLTMSGATIVSLGVFTAPSSFPALTVAASSSVSLAVFIGLASFPTVTPTGAGAVTLAVFTGVASFPTVTPGAGSGVTLAVFTGAASFPALSVGSGAAIPLAVFTGLASFPALTVAASSAVSLAVFTGLASFPSIELGGDADVTLAAFTGAALFPALTISGAGAVTLAAFTGLASFPVITPHGAGSVTIVTFTAVSSFPALNVTAVTRVTLAVFTGVPSFPALTVHGAGAVSLGTFTGLASFPVIFALALTFTGARIARGNDPARAMRGLDRPRTAISIERRRVPRGTNVRYGI